ncbi:AP endonuclease, family 2 [Verrucomicrobiia bacterium DG1235]|nr:AP endonuclease, family 2 [Verrucomicrobiae bacterium DG1235]
MLHPRLAVSLLAILALAGCAKNDAPAPDLFGQENLIAWCIVPFDSVKRSPVERVAMLKRLNFSQYAWDWREHHLALLPQELKIAKQNGIRMSAVWLWIDETQDKVGSLSAGNLAVMKAIADAGVKTEYWVGFHENVFADLTDAQCIEKGAAMTSYLEQEAAKSGSTISLYNHGDWFGESENQIAIIEATGKNDIGMVYNFHHAHHEIDEFEDNLERMLPHLTAINLNGMNPEGPKIMRIGEGTREKEMLTILQESGYAGPIGILGHDDTQDVEKILAKNLEGLRKLTAEL